MSFFKRLFGVDGPVTRENVEPYETEDETAEETSSTHTYRLDLEERPNSAAHSRWMWHLYSRDNRGFPYLTEIASGYERTEEICIESAKYAKQRDIKAKNAKKVSIEL